MDNRVEKQLEILVNRYPELSGAKKEISEAYQILENCYAHGGKLLVAGNGGSAADAAAQPEEKVSAPPSRRKKCPTPSRRRP